VAKSAGSVTLIGADDAAGAGASWAKAGIASTNAVVIIKVRIIAISS